MIKIISWCHHLNTSVLYVDENTFIYQCFHNSNSNQQLLYQFLCSSDEASLSVKIKNKYITNILKNETIGTKTGIKLNKC